MQRRSILSLAFLACVAGASPSHAGDAENIALFQGLYEKAHATYQSKDRTAIKALFDDSFVSIDIKDARRTADQVIDAILRVPAELSRDRHTTVTAVTITGDTAEVQQQSHVVQEKADSSGAKHVMMVDAKSRDIWVSRDGIWRIKENRADAVDLSIDGTVVAHKVRPPS